ncbi:MAG: hypothetical protein AAF663_13180 [Planctomycetota bacterium]
MPNTPLNLDSDFLSACPTLRRVRCREVPVEHPVYIDPYRSGQLDQECRNDELPLMRT